MFYNRNLKDVSLDDFIHELNEYIQW
ncbi:hypothetical protein EXM22_02795 [Oceanispirochaeta crateris]|uniref:Uncharacterized protein n=1 Tax=Oceanispirochaeta crateris TaxID=2518645 RepID=A0A5C1QTG5_9SPIO|nr:hypothetical protein EXM22_02795 [Oceanispirochaeta crateris]